MCGQEETGEGDDAAEERGDGGGSTGLGVGASAVAG